MTPAQALALAEVLKAFAEGRPIQYQDSDGTWYAPDTFERVLFDGIPVARWRIEPKKLKYRRYIRAGSSAGHYVDTAIPGGDEVVEARHDFIRWIDADWVEVEL